MVGWAELHPTSVSSGGVAALPCQAFCVYLRSRQFFMSYLCHSLRSAVGQVVGVIALVAGWGFTRDTILSAVKCDQCTLLNPICNQNRKLLYRANLFNFNTFFCCTLSISPNSFCWQSLRCIKGQKPCHSQNVSVRANRCGSFIRQSQHPRRHCWPV